MSTEQQRLIEVELRLKYVTAKCGKVKTGKCLDVGNCNLTTTLGTDCADINVVGAQ